MATKLLHILFVCTANRLRSPTAKAVFSSRPDLRVVSRARPQLYTLAGCSRHRKCRCHIRDGATLSEYAAEALSAIRRRARLSFLVFRTNTSVISRNLSSF